MVHQASTLFASRAPRRQRPGRGPATGPARRNPGADARSRCRGACHAACGPRRLTQRRAVGDGSWSRIAGLTPPRLLAVFLVALVLPFGFNLAGLQLNAYNSVLIVCIIPAFLYFSGCRTPASSGSTSSWRCTCSGSGWRSTTPTAARIVFIINQSLMLFGAYFMGRVLVRNAEDYRG